jgi:hypothetical protein
MARYRKDWKLRSVILNNDWTFVTKTEITLTDLGEEIVVLRYKLPAK